MIKNRQESAKKSKLEMSVSEKELMAALFDYAIKELYPDTWELTKKAVQLHTLADCHELNIILNCSEYLSPVVNFMQNVSDLGTVEQIYEGLKALNSLGLHKSVQLSKHLINSIDE